MTYLSVKPTVRRRPFYNTDRWLHDLLNDRMPVPAKTDAGESGYPRVNILEGPDRFSLRLAAPGMAKEDFEMIVEKDVLNIKGKRDAVLKEGETFRRKEFGASEFERTFRLPETVDAGAISATYVNGILEVVIPKREEAKEQPARKVEIG